MTCRPSQRINELQCDPALRAVIESFLENLDQACAVGDLIELRVGFSGTRIYKFEYKDQYYLLRLLGHGERGLLTAVHRELESTCIASDLAIAPQVYYCNRRKGAIVTQFIDGVHPLGDYFDDTTHREQLLGLLRRMHQHPGESLGGYQSQSFFELIEYRLVCYASMLSDDDARSLREILHTIKSAIDPAEDPIGFCHFDLHMNNMLVDKAGRLYFLDWGDAGIGSCLADLALLSIFTKRDYDQAIVWLNHYLQTPSSQIMQENFLKYRSLSYLLQFTAALEAMHNMGASHISLAECDQGCTDVGMTHFDRAQLHFSGTHKIDSVDDFQEYAKLCWHSVRQCLGQLFPGLY